MMFLVGFFGGFLFVVMALVVVAYIEVFEIGNRRKNFEGWDG